MQNKAKKEGISKKIPPNHKTKERNEMFQAILDSSRDVIVLFNLQNQRYEYVSPSVKDLVGFTPDEFSGMDIKTAIRMVHPDDLPNFRSAIALAETNGFGVAEYRQKTKSSEYIWISNYMSIIKDAHGKPLYRVINLRDITGRKKIEEALKESEAKANSLIKYAPTAIYEIDYRNFRFISMNDAVTSLTGYSKEELLSQSPSDLLIGDSKKLFAERVRRRLAGEKIDDSVEFQIRKKDGSIMYAILNTSFSPDNPDLAFVIGHDITERKKAEEAIKNNEKLLQSFFDSPGIMRGIVEIVDDSTVRHIADNALTAEFVGLSTEALRNKLSSELGEPPEIIRTWVSHYRQSLETGMPVTFEYEDNRGDKKAWLSATVSYLGTADSGQPQFTYVVVDITGRKESEEALKASEEKYRNLFVNMTEGFALCEIVVGSDGKPVDYRALEVNQAWEKLTGLSAAQIVGKGFKEMIPDLEQYWVDIYGKVALTGEPTHVENYNKFTDHWYEIFAYSPRKGYFVSLVQNITERKKTEEALKANEEQFQAMANNIPQLAWMADGEGWIFWYNQRWYDYTGTNLEEMKGWGWQKVHHPDYVEPVTEKFKKYVATGEAWEDTFPLRGKDGNYRWFLSRAFAIRDNNGKVMRWFGTNTDITEKLEAEENLRRYSSDLEVSNKELEAFAYSVSHDLRAPLRTLDGFSKAVMEDYEDKLDDTGKDYLRRVRDAAKHMDQITRDMLTLSRVIRSDLRMGDVNLSNIVSTIANELSEKAPSRKVEFIISPDVIVRGDASLLQMALFNLMENAWKFTAKSKEARIEFGTMVKDDERIYFIGDNGVGFDMRYVNKLFQPFQRLHTDADYPGTGIGLAIVQRVIRRHGGRIWAESQEGKGTTIYFTLG
jgi:PAS domain S-box-containing protein